MTTLEDYDGLLTTIYDAGAGKRSMGDALVLCARHFDAASAGLLIYDETGEQIAYSVVCPAHTVSLDWQAQFREIMDDPGIQILSRIRLSTPRRFTDLVPSRRLRSARWFLRQEALAGLGHGMAVDLDFSGIRARMFGMRLAGAPDFRSESLDMLGRVGLHFQRAFTGAAHCLAPHRVGEDAIVLVFKPDDVAVVMRDVHPVEQRLALRYGLTPAEARAAGAAAVGLSREQTAEQLGISLNSLKTHLRRVYSKLNINRASELVHAVKAPDGLHGASRNCTDGA